jgi:hypothetical protein
MPFIFSPLSGDLAVEDWKISSSGKPTFAGSGSGGAISEVSIAAINSSQAAK